MLLCLVLLSLTTSTTTGLHTYVSPNVDAKLMYQLSTVDYEWPSQDSKMAAISKGDYIKENNLAAGLKVYKDTVYVTVPRWRDGVPSSLNSLITAAGGQILMRPFPSWEMNKEWDCTAFQYVQSMEVDPNTGYMWILDTGRTNTLNAPSPAENLCPAKLWILDIDSKALIRTYAFPDSVVSRTSNFMNDIVLDYVDGVARFAYITDTSDSKLYVYDFVNDESWYIEDDSMKPKGGVISKPIDGIAMSADFRYVYYDPLGARELYAIPTYVLRNKSSDFAKNLLYLGNKAGGADGMAFGQKSLFYACIEQNAVLKVTVQGHNAIVSMATEETVISNSESVQWADTFAFNGTDLWFVANKNAVFQARRMDFSGNTANMYIWKMKVGEHGYLWDAARRTRHWHQTPGIFG